jgi:hypothetical protein
VKEYDVFIPLYYNDGLPVEARKLQRLHARLLDQFDGLTFFPQPTKGIGNWPALFIATRLSFIES